MAKFESHITCKREDSEKVKRVAEITGWKFSAIDGDPLLGKQPYAYLTSYHSLKDELYLDMRKVEARLKKEGVEVLRTKIERIIWDTKTGVDELSQYIHERWREIANSDRVAECENLEAFDD